MVNQKLTLLHRVTNQRLQRLQFCEQRNSQWRIKKNFSFKFHCTMTSLQTYSIMQNTLKYILFLSNYLLKEKLTDP